MEIEIFENRQIKKNIKAGKEKKNKLNSTF